MIVPVIKAECGCSFEVIVASREAHTLEERFSLRRWRRCEHHPEPTEKQHA